MKCIHNFTIKACQFKIIKEALLILFSLYIENYSSREGSYVFKANINFKYKTHIL